MRGFVGLEYEILTSIQKQAGRANCHTLHSDLMRPVAHGAIYTTAQRLEEKGFITSELGNPTPVRGGKAMRFYTITEEGTKALTGDTRKPWQIAKDERAEQIEAEMKAEFDREKNMLDMTRAMHGELFEKLDAIGIDFFELRAALKTADREEKS